MLFSNTGTVYTTLIIFWLVYIIVYARFSYYRSTRSDGEICKYIVYDIYLWWVVKSKKNW